MPNTSDPDRGSDVEPVVDKTGRGVVRWSDAGHQSIVVIGVDSDASVRLPAIARNQLDRGTVQSGSARIVGVQGTSGSGPPPLFVARVDDAWVTDESLDVVKDLQSGSTDAVHDFGLASQSLISIPTPDPPPELLAAIGHLVERFADDEASTDQKIADALEATHALPTSAHLHSLRTHESAWRSLEEGYGALTAAQIGAMRQSTAKNRAAYASQLRARGQVIGVQRRGTLVFPMFQFDENIQPRPGMKDVIRTFNDCGWSDDSICLWMIAPNGRLGARRPADVLAAGPSGVLEAAVAVTTEW